METISPYHPHPSKTLYLIKIFYSLLKTHEMEKIRREGKRKQKERKGGFGMPLFGKTSPHVSFIVFLPVMA